MSPRRRHHAARLVVGGVKLAAVGGVATLMLVGPHAGAGSAAGTDSSTPPGQAHLDRLMAAGHCSTSGFGPNVIPGSAIVERAGHVAQVSFDVGWATYTGDRPGTLLAVCRATV